MNEGVTAIYRALVLAFRFSSPRQSAVVRTDAHVRKWLTGDAVYEGAVFVPENLAAQDYDLSVVLLDPITLEPRRSPRFRGTR